MMKILKTSLPLFIILASRMLGYSQTFEDKLSLYFAGGISNTKGEKQINEENYITPALYPNYENGYNFEFKGMYKVIPYLSVGLQFNNTKFSNWNYGEKSTLYANSDSKISTIAPVIQVHTKFQMQGFFNRTKLYAEVKPAYGQSSLTLAEPIIDVQSNNGSTIEVPATCKSQVAGIETSIGIGFSISQSIGLYTNFSYDFYKVKSIFFNDKNIRFTSIDLGFYIRLIKNKHYY